MAITKIADQHTASPKEHLRTLELANRLHTTLDLNKMLELLTLEMGSTVPFDGIHYHNEAQDYEFRHGKTYRHSCNYRLLMGGHNLGEIHFYRARKFTESETMVLENLLSALLNPLHNAIMYRSALNSALKDPLTQLNNRAALQTTLFREISLAQRHDTQLAMMVIDIDLFKNINDQYGHLFGDCVLRDTAQRIREIIRTSDMVFRYGGEEFVILLSNTNTDGARLLAERLRKGIANMHCRYAEQVVSVTVSVGIACLKAGESATELFNRADSALYAAKRKGRNRTILACDEGSETPV